MATQKTTPLVVGNWKMNPGTLAEAKQLFVAIRAAAKQTRSVRVVVAPPALFLLEVAKLSPSRVVGVAAQNTHEALLGAHTGEISALMVANIGAEMVILGHSERRAAGETDTVIQAKVTTVLKSRLTPIVCVGERERDESGDFYSVVEQQIAAVFQVVPKTRVKDVVLAYEPVWAIGTGKTATVEEVQEMQLFITKILTKLVGRAAAVKVRILYGGSVKPENAHALYHETGMSGFLVGGASLDSKAFASIITAVENRL